MDITEHPILIYFSPIIPFLLLGIGVDDMFVIVQSLDNLEARPGERPEERVARALEHAGVSILVTSITDAATFFIGSTSVCNMNFYNFLSKPFSQGGHAYVLCSNNNNVLNPYRACRFCEVSATSVVWG